MNALSQTNPAQAAGRWRWTELSLLPMPVLFLSLGFALLEVTHPGVVKEGHVRGAFVAIVFVLLAHFALVWRRSQGDQMLFPLATMLSAMGMVVVTRLAPEAALRQSAWIGIGITLFAVIALFLPSVVQLQAYKYTAAILGLVLVATTFVFGVDPNGSGARLWLNFAGNSFQPSELLKVLLVLFLAGYLEDKRELLAWTSSRLGGLKLPPLPYLGPLIVLWAVSLLMLIAQRDLGATLLFFGIFLAMLYMASGRGMYVWGGLGALGAGAYICYLLFAHVRLRVDIWIDPWSHAQDQGYQVVQALVALASGGIFGSGLGEGYPLYIPAVQTDFIIAAIGEELGLVGTLGVVALFMMLVYRGFRIALDATDGFSTLLAAGLSAVLGLQAIIILAGTLKLVPLTGITLPFVSYGGSSLVTNFLIVGILHRISEEGRTRRGA